MIWDEFLRHFRFCDEEDSGLSDEKQERKGPKNRPKHTRKQIHKPRKTFWRNSKQLLRTNGCKVGAIAQLVEQRTENPCVPGSIPGGTTLKKSKRQ